MENQSKEGKNKQYVQLAKWLLISLLLFFFTRNAILCIWRTVFSLLLLFLLLRRRCRRLLLLLFRFCLGFTHTSAVTIQLFIHLFARSCTWRDIAVPLFIFHMLKFRRITTTTTTTTTVAATQTKQQQQQQLCV